jgi:hypothetical protein
MDLNKILEGSLDEIADNIFNESKNARDKAKAIQKQRIGENVQYVIEALKKIETDLRGEYGDVADKLSERIASIRDGKDGRNGSDGRAGKDGRAGRDGLAGSKGADGLPGRDGIDGVDGVSVMDASIDFDGSLIISLSNGRVINVGEVVSQDLADKIQVISTMSTNGAVGIQDEGTSISTGVKNINFVGASVTSTASGDNVTVNIGAAGTGVFDAGTALLPSITTTGDLNTGVYFPAADTVGITAGGTQRGSFSSTGLAVTGAISATNATIDGGAGSSLTIFRLGAAQSGNLISMRNAAGTELLSVNGSITTLTTPSINITSGSILNYVGSGFIRGTGNLKIHDTHSGNIEMAVGGGVVLIGSATAVSGAKLEVTGTLSATGVATFAAGTAALPSITTTGDTNTGVYFPAADTVGITAGGTQRGAFSSTGLQITGSVGQGLAPTAEYGYRMSFLGATAAIQYGFFIDAFSDSAGTSATIAIRARARTSAAVYTSSSAIGLAVEGPAAGAGSTITSAFGIQVQDQTVGTNNYGIQTQVTSGTNKYNIYASGSAQNYFAGTVGIGTVSPNASAILDAQSTTKGVRMPNMTTTQKNAIASPAAGLMVYDTTLAKLCVYTTAWQTITSV